MKSQAALAATMIRKEIKAKYPELKFTCRSEVYSMGSSIRIAYEDQPRAVHEDIRAMAHKYQYGHFDGMTDCYNYDNGRDHPQAKHVFVDNHMSDAKKQEVYQNIRMRYFGGENLPPDYTDARNMNLQGQYVSEWVWQQFARGEAA